MTLTVQTLLHRKLFGDYLSQCRPLEYRRKEWKELCQGKDRAVRLIVRAMLGVPSAHVGQEEHAAWCFQFQGRSLLVLYVHMGHAVEMASGGEDTPELREAVDFLISEVGTKLKQL
jgi:hypothetical protein